MITVEHIHSKMNKKLGLLRRVKLIYLLSLGWRFSRALFYHIWSGPDYGEIIWGDQGNSALTDDLQVLQNKAARIILDFQPHASSSDALAKLHWKPLLRRRAGHRAIFINKSIDKFFSMLLNLVLIVILMIVIPDLETILGKPQLKEGRAIGPISPLLQMSRNPLICLLVQMKALFQKGLRSS